MLNNYSFQVRSQNKMMVKSGMSSFIEIFWLSDLYAKLNIKLHFWQEEI